MAWSCIGINSITHGGHHQGRVMILWAPSLFTFWITCHVRNSPVKLDKGDQLKIYLNLPLMELPVKVLGMEIFHVKWASCQIRKIAGCACAGNAGNVFPTYRLQRKPQVSDPGMHHGTCVTHVPWCMSESLIRGGGENVPGIPGACATRNFAYLTRGPWYASVDHIPNSYHI